MSAYRARGRAWARRDAIYFPAADGRPGTRFWRTRACEWLCFACGGLSLQRLQLTHDAAAAPASSTLLAGSKARSTLYAPLLSLQAGGAHLSSIVDLRDEGIVSAPPLTPSISDLLFTNNCSLHSIWITKSVINVSFQFCRSAPDSPDVP